jgi:hypothetical protein
MHSLIHNCLSSCRECDCGINVKNSVAHIHVTCEFKKFVVISAVN